MPNRRPGLFALVLFALVATVLGMGANSAFARGPQDDPGRGGASTPFVSPRNHVSACGDPVAPETARCFSRVVTDAVGSPVAAGRGGVNPSASIGNSGAYDPYYLQLAYGLQTAAVSGGTGTVAIVDAYDNPKAESDLASYRSFFNLPACTTANGCFKKVNQRGATSYPRADAGWGLEISLDLDMVSAICPRCKILLVEADSASFLSLGTAVNYAASLPAVVAISNSYGANEFLGENLFDGYYNHPGKAVTVSSGDGGYGVSYPAASPFVTAVGGTSLVVPSGTSNRTETAWSGAGSGCSAYESQPAWQAGLGAGCSRRLVADVSAVADPSTGVWVYDSYGGYRGWYVVGGTSASSPIIASVYALSGNTSVATAGLRYGSYPYGQQSSLNDVVGGSNGNCAKATPYLCTGVAGYDGPTGLGTPKGAGGF